MANTVGVRVWVRCSVKIRHDRMYICSSINMSYDLLKRSTLKKKKKKGIPFTVCLICEFVIIFKNVYFSVLKSTQNTVVLPGLKDCSSVSSSSLLRRDHRPDSQSLVPWWACLNLQSIWAR